MPVVLTFHSLRSVLSVGQSANGFLPQSERQYPRLKTLAACFFGAWMTISLINSFNDGKAVKTAFILFKAEKAASYSKGTVGDFVKDLRKNS